MLNLNQSFQNYQIPYFNIGVNPTESTPNSDFNIVNIANPYLKYLQERFFMLYLTTDVFTYIEMMAAGTTISFQAPPNNYTLTDADKLEFLSFVGNIVGLQNFSLPTPTGFILNVSKLNVDRLGYIPAATLLTSSQYANILLARFYKFYSNCSLDNIIKTVQLVSQQPLSNITATISGLMLNFTINVTNYDVQTVKAFIEYLDPLGYNLWMKPSYGIVKFTYTS